MPVSAFRSVSYTHLDVYKRQQWKNEIHPADQRGERGTNRRRAPAAVRMPGSAPYALPTEPNSSIFSFTVAWMASTPGASSCLLYTSKTAELDKVKGLDGGADDYMTKPFGCLLYTSRCV